MNVASLTSRYLRSLVKMKGRLESDLAALNSTLQKFDAGAIPAPRQMSAKHKAAIRKAIRSRNKSK